MSRAECVALYAGGYTMTEIAKMCGVAKSTISRHLKLAREGAGDAEITSLGGPGRTCPHSPSCFTCPLKDCALEQSVAPRYNVLPAGFEYMREVLA